MFTPGTLPARELTTLVFLFFINSAAFRSVTEYPNAFRSFFIPKAVTTTSAICTDSPFDNRTSMPVDAAIVCVE